MSGFWERPKDISEAEQQVKDDENDGKDIRG